MLQPIAPNLWHAVHHFKAAGIPISSRMTVVRFPDGTLWLHSPVPIDAALKGELDSLGEVAWIVAPNRMHHLFARPCLALYPRATLYGAPGLPAKRPGLPWHELGPTVEPAWAGELEQILFDGVPIGNEVVWFHRASATLILTDVCQWWQGDLPFAARCYAALTGVRREVAVPRTVRLATRDRAAARAAADAVLRWPFTRVIMAHNSIVEEDAHGRVRRAFACYRP